MDIKSLPIRPGDITYVVEKACDWRVHTEKVKAVCIMEDGVHIIPETCEYNLQHESEGCFITEKEALSYADAHRPEPPYEYWRDALSWMDVERYVPYHSGWYYVRVISVFICVFLVLSFTACGTGQTQVKSTADVNQVVSTVQETKSDISVSEENGDSQTLQNETESDSAVVYVPYRSGWYYVRVGEYVCKAYY